MTAGALGLGEITLRSALNQPFVAEIPVTAESGEELNQLTVQLAPAASFERFGLDRPRFLDGFSFQVRRDGSRAVVRITSSQPVSEPFVSLLLDVGWPQGRLLREYTVLLDPPTFARQDAVRPAAPPPPVAPPAARPSVPAIQRTDRADGAVAPRAPTGTVTSGPTGDTYGPVRSNETLWAISERLRADGGVSLNQMMVALYRANPEAFAGNINRLRRGAILRVPPASDLASVKRREASAEVQRQDVEWRAESTAASPPARLQLVPPTQQPAPTGPGTGSTSAATTAAERAALERELAEKQRLLSVKDSQLKALQDRVSQLEGRAPAAPPAVAPSVVAPSVVAPVQAPVEAPVAVPDSATGEPPVESAVPPAEVAAGTEAEASSPAAPAREPAKRPARERQADGGLFKSLTGLVFNVWFLVSAAVVLLAGLLVFGRRRMAAADEGLGRFGNELRAERLGGSASTQPLVRRDDYRVEEATADKTQVALGRGQGRDADAETALERTISTEGAVELDQADVVAEADFHMAYGLYDQAAELLTRALRDGPDRRDLRLKLLEVYFIWENKAAFLKEAQTLHRQLNGAADPDWNKVVIMGKQICPGEALFAGSVGTTGDVVLDIGQDSDEGGVDISFDEGAGQDLDLDLTGARKGPAGDILDFDLGELTDGESLDDTSMMQTEIAPRSGRDAGSRTAEVPTIEAPYAGDYSPTMETPTIEARATGTVETPTLESAVPGLRSEAADLRRASGGDQTEEINLEDLGLDLTGLDEAAGDLGTGIHASMDAGAADEAYDLSAEEEASDLLEGLAGDATGEMPGMTLDEGTLDLPAFGNAMSKRAAGVRGGSRDTTSDTAEHRVVEDTAEQPRVSATSLGEASAELSQVDFDIGEDGPEDLEPTAVLTGKRRGPEGPTMTEVGTKLDLARAYVDMGDPDGARSILNEVLEEGDSAQRQEARRLLDDLAD
ncbi:MAG: FimV/HubP family polar landmark protein [Gammaproteobacteria bacterium]